MAAPKRTARKRPWSVAFLAGVLAVGGVLFVIGAAVLLLANQLGIYRGALAQVGVPQDQQISTGLLALAGGVVLLVLAVGLFRLRRWAWGLGVLVLGANVGVTGIAIHNGVMLAPDQIITVSSAA